MSYNLVITSVMISSKISRYDTFFIPITIIICIIIISRLSYILDFIRDSTQEIDLLNIISNKDQQEKKKHYVKYEIEMIS